jgi:cyclohexanone monooxygenase
MTGVFAGFDIDPHADPQFRRDPIVEDVEVAIIGGGFAGLLAGGRLRERGVQDIRIIEKGADFGGAWYWNRYPGAACDTESYIYLPMLEESGYIPTEKYAKADEIRDYCCKLAQHYRLYDGALFQTGVTLAEWDETRSRWIVSTDRDDRLAARFLISCTGLLSKPKLPGIPGIESFAGRTFHTSRWDYGYTGGGPSGHMTGLADKAVGIVGTGSTGVQAIPHIAASAKHLYVFQRTPAPIGPRDNRPTDPAWAESLAPGWQRRRRDNFTAIVAGLPHDEDMVQDGWTDMSLSLRPARQEGQAAPDAATLKRANFARMEASRRRIGDIVGDPATAEALKPYYHVGCKRPCFHDDYLPAFNRPNVTLVDTEGRGVERITPGGLVAGGNAYDLDCLIFATGFEWLTEFAQEFGFDLVGPGGLTLSQHWAKGARTLHGMQTHGFPNFFLISVVQAAATPNYVFIADEQTTHVAYVIDECLKRGVQTVQPTRKAEADWIDVVMTAAGPRRAFFETCTPGIFNNEGRREEKVELNEFYWGSPFDYIERLQAFRRAEDMPGLEWQAVR